MGNFIDLAAVGPEIDLKNSQKLQAAVSEKLLVQAEEVIFASAAMISESADAFAAVVALRQFSTEQRMRIVLHPSFRYWLRAMLRTSQEENFTQRSLFIQRLTDFVWSEQAAQGQLTRLWMVTTDEHGGLRCPSLGRFIELGTSYANQMVKIAPTPTDDGVIIRCQDGLTIQIPPEDLKGSLIEPPPTLEEHGYRVVITPVVADGRVEVSTRDPWLRVKLTGTNQRTDGVEFFGSSNDLYLDNPSKENLINALGLLKEYWTEGYNDFAQFTYVIVPVDFGQNTYRAFTVSSRQGAIYIGDAPPEATIEMLLHENAHVKLRQIQFLDTLLSDPWDESVRLPVPWRTDHRPIPGIFEGVFVFAHVAEFEWRRLQTDGTGVSRERLTKRVQDLQYAVSCLEQNARFTEEGVKFFRAMRYWIHSLDQRIADMQALR